MKSELADKFFDYVEDKVWNDRKLLIRLLEMRGGCCCCVSPPCNACVEPITFYEADRLGFCVEDFSRMEKAEAIPTHCTREACEAWVHPDPKPHRPELVERHGMMVCPKCRSSYGPAPDDGHDPMHAVRDFCK